jgi:hypothetical protein
MDETSERVSDSTHERAPAAIPAPWDALAPAALRGFLESAAKLWLAHDGLWFQAVEQRFGMDAAIDCDADAWARFSPLEARRILQTLAVAPGGGLPVLARALRHRLYSLINQQSITQPDASHLVLRMESCRVQDARRRKGLSDFPCQRVGLVEYTTFARAIDPRIEVRCLHCPPDARSRESVCAWEFSLPREGAP